MKKIVYTIGFLLASLSSVKAQTPIKETREAIADVLLFQDDLLIYTKKEADGQYLYTEKRGDSNSAQKATGLNGGNVNSVIGNNNASAELYVFQQQDRKNSKLVFYKLQNGAFSKTEERDLPKMMNHSYNLGLFLTSDKNTLYIAAELNKSYGYDDIYVSHWQNNKWSKPKNIGKEVNTRQPEFAPYVANDSLFFSRKQDQASYVYAIPLKDGKAAGTAAKLDNSINKENAFNAYYKQVDDREMWITRAIASNEGGVTDVPSVAYITGHKPVVTEPKPEVVIATPAPAKPKPAREASFNYEFNEVFLAESEVEKLIVFLEQHEAKASLEVIGYSDMVGPGKGKQNVSRQRAAFVKWLIEQKLPNKEFQIQTRQQVLNTKGENGYKTEITIK